jgi:two-component system, chemotaxis family, protein-glutamate methylesterase/glutaminase
MIRAIVIGASSGGMEAIRLFLSGLPEQFSIPVIIVLHIGSNNINHYLSLLNNRTSFIVKEAAEKEPIVSNTVYFAPPNYHLQIETNLTFSLTTDVKVNYSRPSIDVLFETAAWAYKDKLLGILLTGSNSDGANGMQTIKKYGGTTFVENPASAYGKTMPRSAIELITPDYVLDLADIAPKVNEVCLKIK